MSRHLTNRNNKSPPPLSEATAKNGIKDDSDEIRSAIAAADRQVMATDLAATASTGSMNDEYQKRLFAIRQHQQQLGEQVLLVNLQQQQQLQEHLKLFLRKQQNEQRNAENHHLRVLEEEQQRNNLVNAVLNKDKSRASANASTAVKQHLQKFVIGRQKGKTFDGYPNNVIERSRLRWTPSLDSRNGCHDLSAPYPQSMLMDKRSSFPLRKTASEPNLKLRSRIRAKVTSDRRSSPLLPRSADVRADLANRIKRKLNTAEQDNSACNSAPNSSPSSPLNSNSNINNSSTTGNSIAARVGLLPGHSNASEAEFSSYGYPLSMVRSLQSGRDLYTSPSLPNISLGKSDGSTIITGAPHGVIIYPDPDLQRLALARTASLPGPLMQQMYKLPGRFSDMDGVHPYAAQLLQQQQTAKAMLASSLAEVSGKGSSPPGPIRHTPLTRPHKVLSRTHSAPTTTAQLQQHILQRKRLLQQQHKHAPYYVTGLAAEASHYRPLATHRESAEHGESSKQRLSKKLAASPPPTHPSAISSTTAAALVSHLGNKKSAGSYHHFPTHPDRKLTSSPSSSMDHSPSITEKLSRSVIVAPSSSSHQDSCSDQEEVDVIEVKREQLSPVPDKVPIEYSPNLGHKQTVAMALKSKMGMSQDHLPSRPSALKGRRSLLDGEMGLHRPLTRTQSSPAVSFTQKPPHKKYRYTTGIGYDPVMLRHGCACGDPHAEHSGRLREIWSRLTETGLVKECENIDTRKATMAELQLAHTEEHTLRYGATPLARQQSVVTNKFIILPCGGVGVDNGIDIDTVWNELDTINAARMAVGLTLDLALSVAANELRNGFAVVRPPGHHAEKDLAMAFCYFNSVAVAARQLQQTYPDKIRRILIVDWDVHHCNGTQNIFYDDPSVLVISIHRYDDGNFFPGNTGSPLETGEGAGVGFNVNIGFSGGLNPPLGDAEYLAAFRTVVMPIAEEFNPDFVLVSAGFSAVDGHPPVLGGYKVTPQCFGYLTSQLMKLANGRIVMALEGGFVLEPLCDSVEICARTLLSDVKGADVAANSLPVSSLNSVPCDNAVRSISHTSRIQERYWSRLKRMSSYANISQAAHLGQEQADRACVALASLTVDQVKSKSKDILGLQSSDQRKLMSKSFSHVKDKDCDRDDKDDKLVVVTDPFEDPLPPSGEVKAKDTEDDAMSSESSPLDVVGVSSPSPPPSSSPAPSPARHVSFAAEDVARHDASPANPAAMADRQEDKMTSVKEDEPMDQEDGVALDEK